MTRMMHSIHTENKAFLIRIYYQTKLWIFQIGPLLHGLWNEGRAAGARSQ
jgi:hypothetical protein